ncbi:unnamed protein product [Didymodactylos carnosus]|uniref:Heparan-alpha-glucosaminide N-acetyltransferase n=1 Tax=Didymodactylos carnosus TaxID=1234261 RepID=A0A813XGH2_9BILA|nr:unnamed protein product [Didymodactylos carnosus]CAF0903007.1 unnamed protein product [Didymodactylos carnosus]CAF3662637.1 unnamed protein product [Didymodactylos carnosus]CAF3683381.1 unnamed protein product [Didymodactylos carnosus]
MESTHYDRKQQCYPIHRRISSGFNQQSKQDYLNITRESRQSPTEPPIAIEENSENTLISLRTGTVQINTTNSLGIDEAGLNIITDPQVPGNVTISVQIVECVNCPYETLVSDLSPSQTLNLTINTKYTYRLRIELNNATVCLETLNLYEHGQYVFNIQSNTGAALTNGSSDTALKCTLTTRRLSNNIYTPLIVGGVIVLSLFIACLFAQRMKLTGRILKMKERFFNHVPPQQSQSSYNLQQPHVTTATVGQTTICSHITNHHHETTTATIDSVENHHQTKPIPSINTANVIVPRSKRLLSLDAFRGLALVAMIFVDYGGGGYTQFEHAPWHGITFADLMFPWFIWIMGVSIIFSLKNSLDRNVPKRKLLWKVALRVIKLFLIGFILNTHFKVYLSEVRILGVLQRFAIVYAVIATIEVLCARKHMFSVSTNHLSAVTTTTTTKATTSNSKRMTSVFRDVFNFPLQWLAVIGLTTIWVLIIYLVPFGECPAGYLGPERLTIFFFIYRSGGIHENGTYINCTGGITGYIDRIIFSERHLYQYPTCQLIYGCTQAFDPENLLGALPTIFLAYLGVQAGRILVMYQKDMDRLIRLFSWSIFTTAIGIGLTGGLAYALFALMYILIDMFKIWNGCPFQYPGTNSILIYMSHIIFATYFPVQWMVAETHAAHLAMAIWGTLFWIIIAYIFFQKRIFFVL